MVLQRAAHALLLCLCLAQGACGSPAAAGLDSGPDSALPDAAPSEPDTGTASPDTGTTLPDAGAPDLPDAAAAGFDAAPVTWAATFASPGNDDGLGLALSPTGGSIVVGVSYAGGDPAAWAARLDGAGQAVWQKSYAGTGEERANAVRAVPGGGYVVAGHSSSSGAGKADAWVLRLDEDGAILWQKTFGGPEADWANAVLPLATGGFLVVGYTESFGAGGRDAWALRLDAGGALIWQRALGGAAMDSFNAVEAVAGGFVACGFTKSFGESAVDGIPDLWLLKLSADGDTLWQKTYGGSGFEYGMALRATAAGGLAVTGWTSSYSVLPNSSGAVWVLSLDADGVPAWQQILDGDNWQEGRGLWPTASGGLLVAGTTWSFGSGGKDVWLVELDAAGAIVWERTYGGGQWDNGHALEALPDGSLLVAGNAMSYSADGSPDVLVLKTRPGGALGSGCTGYGTTSQADRIPTSAQAATSTAASLAPAVTAQEGAATEAEAGLTRTTRCGP